MASQLAKATITVWVGPDRLLAPLQTMPRSSSKKSSTKRRILVPVVLANLTSGGRRGVGVAESMASGRSCPRNRAISLALSSIVLGPFEN